jgi:hypothetical protein
MEMDEYQAEITSDRTSEDVAVPDHGAGLAGWSDPDRT